jgi:hypothetical protein
VSCPRKAARQFSICVGQRVSDVRRVVQNPVFVSSYSSSSIIERFDNLRHQVGQLAVRLAVKKKV